MTDNLITLCLLGEATAQEVEKLDLWIAESEMNKKYYEDFKSVWEMSLLVAENSDVDENQAWERFQERISHPKIIWFRPWMAVASVLLVATFAWLYFSTKDSTDPQSFTYKTTQKPETFILPDSSVVVLNKNSYLTFVSKGKTRDATLSGEAFFDVKPDKSKPFNIEVNKVKVQVLGTSFNIKGYDGETEVVVETGLVQVSSGSRDVQLRAKETVLILSQELVLQKKEIQNQHYNFYRTGKLEFNNASLEEVVKVLNEAYNLHIEIVSGTLNSMTISTVFENQTIENILKIITETLPIRVEKKNQSLLLYSE